ncbi:MAG: transcriptional regulator [Burkholderiales bacterium]|jgi:hypothetical protein|nr:transcriptional regulator [Burkholderiales bacterium]
MLTVIESPLFSRLWPDYWSEDERAGFAAFIAANPVAGDLIRGSGGCRKVRWRRSGSGKSGGVRVIYTARFVSGAVVLLTIYGKSARDTIPPDVLRAIAKELGHGTD